LGKRVLLIDCDMRRPSLADKLPVRKANGLSDFLTGQIGEEELIQPCGLKDGDNYFFVMSSGHTPPNPMELLSSKRMENMIEKLRECYDYIILDLPPVGEVGDALTISKLTDGMLMVVRQNYCDRVALNSAVRQFEFVDAKILGVVFNCTNEGGNRYGYRYGGKYNKRYYRRYYKKYGSAYEDAANKRKPDFKEWKK
jgi:capsular exopolysaccharide synthesis family protein